MDLATRSDVLAVIASLGPSGGQFAEEETWDSLSLALNEAGRLKEALTVVEYLYGCSHEAHGAGHNNSLRYMGRMGSLLAAEGNYADSIAVFDGMARLLTEAEGDTEVMTAVTRYNSASLYHHVGRQEEALPIIQKAYSVLAAALGESSSQALACKVALGRALIHVDQHSWGKTVLEEAIDGYKEAGLKEELIDAIVALNELYVLLGDQEGMAATAKELDLVSGGEDPVVAASIKAMRHMHEGRHEEAVLVLEPFLPLLLASEEKEKKQMQKEEQERKSEKEGEEKTDETTEEKKENATEKGNENQKEEKEDAKEKEEEKSIARTDGGEEEEEALDRVRSILARAYARTGRHEEAVALLQVEYRKLEDSGDAMRQQGAMAALVASQLAAGRCNEALAVAKETVERLRQAHGEENVYFLSASVSLAAIYGSLGERERQRELLERARQGLADHSPHLLEQVTEDSFICHAVLGREMPEEVRQAAAAIAGWPTALVATYQEECELGVACEAVPLRECMVIRRQAFGEYHVDTLAAMRRLAAAYKKAGQMDAAKKLLEKAVARWTAMKGEESEEVAGALGELAALLWAVGEAEEGKAMVGRAVAIKKALKKKAEKKEDEEKE